MSRPAHIAPLDTALEQHLDQLAAAELHQTDLMVKYRREITELEQARDRRMTAYYAAKACEDAIRRLGFVVLDAAGGTVPKGKSRLDDHSGRFNERATD